MIERAQTNILIIYNPTAGAKRIRKIERVVEGLEALDVNVTFSETSYAGHATEIAADAKDQDYDLIVAAGGDGTMNEVINGIYPSKMPVAILPLGTANVLSLEIGLKNNVDAIVDYIANGSPRPCWLGKCNERYFLLMMSVGHDAKAVAYVSKAIKNVIGKGAYGVSFLKALIKAGKTLYHVTVGDKKFTGYNVIVSNGRYYGGKFISSKDANIDDNHFVISMTDKGGWLHTLKYAVLMFTGKYSDSSTITTVSTKRCTIEGDESFEPIQLDGDAIGELPADVTITDEYIELLRP